MEVAVGGLLEHPQSRVEFDGEWFRIFPKESFQCVTVVPYQPDIARGI